MDNTHDLDLLIGRGRDGDEASCAALYTAFHGPVFRLCLALLNNGSDAEEVAQDTFVYAFRQLKAYDPARSAFRTWLFTIAISRCRNKRRRWFPALTALTELDGQTRGWPRAVEAAFERRGVRQEVWRAVQALPEPLRESVVLRYFLDFRYKEIGHVLGCGEKTAQSRVRLALERLRAALRQEAFEWALAWEDA